MASIDEGDPNYLLTGMIQAKPWVYDWYFATFIVLFFPYLEDPVGIKKS